MKRETILVVDDDPGFRKQLVRLLEANHRVTEAGSLDEARKALEELICHCVVLDVRLSPGDGREGLTLLREIRVERPKLPVLMMTGFGDVSTAVEAMKLGASDFLEKGQVDSVGLLRQLRRILDEAQRELRIEAQAAAQERLQPSNLVGGSQAMEPVRESIGLAASDGYCSVLVLGESGTGKSIIARAIHSEGWRRQGPLIEVPTVSLSPELAESELFGHLKGSFTGADRQHTGYIEQSEGGLLFLDEIGDLAPAVQVKLLHFLETRKISMVGSTKSRPVDAQIVAATHQNLEERIQQGRFREDLYYRLKTIQIIVPPLRERLEDIPLLVDHFLHGYRTQGRTRLTGISNRALDRLLACLWPGNIRQLKNELEHAMLLANYRNHSVIEAADLDPTLDTRKMPDATDALELNVEQARGEAEMACADRALRRVQGRKSEAQELLGYPNRQTMRRRILGLRERFPELWGRFPDLKHAYEHEESEP